MRDVWGFFFRRIVMFRMGGWMDGLTDSEIWMGCKVEYIGRLHTRT